MCIRDSIHTGLLLTLLLYLYPSICFAQTTKPLLGIVAEDQLVNEWNTTIFPDGSGLPVGSGTAIEGAKLYQLQCLSCHGPNGQGAIAEELAGGTGTLSDQYPDKTIGLYWPYATTIFDVIRRSMPLQAPGSLSDNETYSLTAYLLAINDLIDGDFTINAETLPSVVMPNRYGFKSIDVDYVPENTD